MWTRIVLVGVAIALAALIGYGAVTTQISAAPSAVFMGLEIAATTEINTLPLVEKPVSYLASPDNIVLRLSEDGLFVLATIYTAVVFSDPTTGEILWKRPVVLADLNAGNFADSKLSAKEYTKKVRTQARAGLTGMPVYIRNVELEKLGTDIQYDSGDNVTFVGARINFEAQLRAFGSGTNALERATAGSLQPDGTILWREHIRLPINGLAFYAGDPAIDSFTAIMEGIRAGATILEDTAGLEIQ